MRIPKQVYCVIHESDLMDLLRRAHDGDDPSIIYAEWYANTDRQDVEAEEPPQ